MIQIEPASLGFDLRRICAPLPARPYSPEWRVSAQAQIPADSGEASFSKLKRCFNFEEEEQRNE
jgi:hypothetical protein